jgi:hypothetical protein
MIKMKLETSYLSGTELRSFRDARAKNEISLFRVRRCDGIHNMDGPGKSRACDVEIPNVIGDDGPIKRYCSKTCFDNNCFEAKGDDEAAEEW